MADPVNVQPAVIQVAPACCCAGQKKGGLAKVMKVVLVVSLLINAYLMIAVIGQVILSNATEKPFAGSMPINDRDPKRIVVLEVAGAIDGAQSEYFSKALSHLDEHEPAALVIHIDSPGGGVSASDQMHHALQLFRAHHKNVKVIASFGGIAASGGYYIAMPCDAIVCERTCITGSIGVIAQVPALGGLAKKFGVEMNTVIADGSPHKADANDLFVTWYDDKGELTPAGRAAKGVLGNMINSAYGRFLEVVEEGRVKNGATKEQVKAFANGKVYTAKEALELKVVDQIGYLDEAVARARKDAGLGEDAQVAIIRHEKGGLASRLLGSSRVAEAGVDLTNIQPSQMRDMLNTLGGVKLEYRLDFPVK